MCHALVSNYLTASSELNWAGIKKLAIFLYLIWCLFVYEMKEIKKISELGDISRTQRLWSNMRNSCSLWYQQGVGGCELRKCVQRWSGAYYCLKPVTIPHICHFFYTDRIFENQILHPKKRLKAPKTLKMSLKKSNICIFSLNLEKFTPDRKFLHRHRLWCLWRIWGMPCVWVRRSSSCQWQLFILNLLTALASSWSSSSPRQHKLAGDYVCPGLWWTNN